MTTTTTERLPDWLENEPFVKQARQRQAETRASERQQLAKELAEIRQAIEHGDPELLAALAGNAEDHKRARAKVRELEAEHGQLKRTLANAAHRRMAAAARIEEQLLSDYDPEIDRVTAHLQEILDTLRRGPEGAVRDRGLDSGMNTTLDAIVSTRASNAGAVKAALLYCQEATATLNTWKLRAAVERDELEALVEGVPVWEGAEALKEYQVKRSIEKADA